MSGIGDLLEACARCALAQGSAACGAYYDDDQSLVVTLEDEAIGRLRRTSSRIPSTSIVLVLALLNVLLGHATADDGVTDNTEKDRSANPTSIMVVCLLFVMLMVMLVLSVHISTSKQVSIEKLNLAFNLTYYDHVDAPVSPPPPLATDPFLSVMIQAMSPRRDVATELVTQPLSLQDLHALLDTPTLMNAKFAAVPENSLAAATFPDKVEMLNRYRNILPNAHTRVVLGDNPADEVGSYVNANFVFGRRFIAAQAPPKAAMAQFWKMVWEQHVEVIVMLTNLVEGGLLKCDQYWPGKQPQKFGELLVVFNVVHKEQHFEVKSFTINHIKTKEARQVQHYWYQDWPDHGVPDSKSGALDQFLDFTDQVRQEATTYPIVVHCSAGVGRSGCFMAVWAAQRQIEQAAVENMALVRADPLRILSQIRKDRGGSIQRPEQFAFVVRACARMIELVFEFANFQKAKGEDVTGHGI